MDGRKRRRVSNHCQTGRIKLELGVLALLHCVELVLAVGDLVVVELEALDEVVVFDLAFVDLRRLRGGLCLLGLFWSSARMGVASHDASYSLVGDFASSSESHALDERAHQAAAHSSGLHRRSGGLRGRLRGGSGHAAASAAAG